ncbi:hypothetical protein REPUB_Repub07fG0041400 [Reevesia pubescens]
MDWNLKAASWDLTEFDEEAVPSIDAVNGSSSYKVPRNKWGFSDDLKLGQAGNAGEESLNKWKEQPGVLKMESSPSKRARAANNGTHQVSCIVDECNSDLSEARRYHRRLKVCEFHAKSAEVMMNGHKQRFCQQCSRFHSLGEFDEGKRSCRRRLAEPNMRRRKPQPDPLSRFESYFSNYQARMQSVLRASGSGLTELQGKEEEWAGKEIHLMDDEHRVSELPKSPNCPSLISLYLQETYELTAIPPLFFLRMALLQVLDLSHTSIKSLPKSLPKLVSLKKLLLRGCELFMELSPQVGKLKNLEELDLDETQIMDLPREIGKLLNLRHLRVSFYHFCGKKKLKSSVLIHPETIANLSLLTELSIDVNPEDKRWDDSVEAVVKEVCSSKILRTLSLYLPKFQLLDNTSLIYPSLSRFRFTVGHHKRRIISRVPHEVEAKFRNGDKCLKFVNGENIPNEIKGVLNYSTSFFLDHHSTAMSLSEFGIENMKRLKFCLLVECNKMETLIDGEVHHKRNEDDRSEPDSGLESLEYLSIYYMDNLGSIWGGPNRNCGSLPVVGYEEERTTGAGVTKSTHSASNLPSIPWLRTSKAPEQAWSFSSEENKRLENDYFDLDSEICEVDIDEDEPKAKKWKCFENENKGVIGPASKTTTGHRIAYRTRSNNEEVDDGYRWRKYGHKIAKENPHARHYYRCSTGDCPVRKLIEPDSEDRSFSIITYEGRHNHDVPFFKGLNNWHSPLCHDHKTDNGEDAAEEAKNISPAKGNCGSLPVVGYEEQRTTGAGVTKSTPSAPILPSTPWLRTSKRWILKPVGFLSNESMCCGSELLKHTPTPTASNISFEDSRPPNVDMNHLTVETEDTFACLLELAANNDVEGFKRSIERDPSGVDEVGPWYGRQKGSKQMVNEERTPLMVAAMYGSYDVIKLILSSSDADVNRVCGRGKSTALHCAASGGAVNAIDVVKLLLAAGADANMVDASGHLPVDVIVVPPKLQAVKLSLEELLATESSVLERNLRVSTAVANSNSPPLSPSQVNGSPSSGSDSPMKSKSIDMPISYTSEKKEYPFDPSLPDIKNSIFSTDEFRMYSFKVRPCSRAYSHDWTLCPFVHPGENARRRDPRKFHYSCVPCPDFRKGACRRRDMCEYAHGVFESWLHPAQYRTQLCKDGSSCARRVCFFAHTAEELRPLYVSTGSAVPSPRSSTSGATEMDFAAASSLLPGSPSSVSVMSPSPFTPPMSPSASGMSHSNVAWPQPNVPALHLPGSNFQSIRLRSSLNARDIPGEDFNLLPDSATTADK